MTDSPNNTSSYASNRHFELRLLISFDLLLITLSAICLLLGETVLFQSVGGFQALISDASSTNAAYPSLAAPLLASLGCIASFIACRLINDRLITNRGFSGSLFAALILLVGGFGLNVLKQAAGTGLFSASLVILLVQWVRLSLPFLTHRYVVLSLVLSAFAAGILCCFSIGILDWHILESLSLLFGGCALFVHSLVFRTDQLPQVSLPCKSANDTLSNVSRSTFAPAMTDGFLLGICLACVGSGNLDGKMFRLELGVALTVCACLSSLQIVPISQYETFMRAHASCFKLIPLLTLALFRNAFEFFASTISLTIVICYILFLVTSLCDRIAFFELSPFCTFGSHGSVFFTACAVGICTTPFFLQTAFSGSICGSAVLFIATIAVEWILIRTYGHKSYFSSVASVETHEDTTSDNTNNPTSKNPDDSFSKNSSEPPPRPQWSDCIRAASKLYELSARQEEVLFLLAKGRTAQFIAENLTVTLATAKSHIYNIYLKFGVHSQQELLDVLESMRDELSPR